MRFEKPTHAHTKVALSFLQPGTIGPSALSSTSSDDVAEVVHVGLIHTDLVDAQVKLIQTPCHSLKLASRCRSIQSTPPFCEILHPHPSTPFGGLIRLHASKLPLEVCSPFLVQKSSRVDEFLSRNAMGFDDMHDFSIHQSCFS